MSVDEGRGTRQVPAAGASFEGADLPSRTPMTADPKPLEPETSLPSGLAAADLEQALRSALPGVDVIDRSLVGEGFEGEEAVLSTYREAFPQWEARAWAVQTVTRTTLSPQRAQTAPAVCLATRPISNFMGSSPMPSMTTSCHLLELWAREMSPGVSKDIVAPVARQQALTPEATCVAGGEEQRHRMRRRSEGDGSRSRWPRGCPASHSL